MDGNREITNLKAERSQAGSYIGRFDQHNADHKDWRYQNFVVVNGKIWHCKQMLRNKLSNWVNQMLAQ